ncbi:hypothetical protein LINPERPRIM_LOCUS20676 [Linum perenne]
MTPGATVILRNAKIDMFKGTMRTFNPKKKQICFLLT